MESPEHKSFTPEIKPKPLRVCPECFGKSCLHSIDRHGKPDELWCEACGGSGWIDEDS